MKNYFSLTSSRNTKLFIAIGFGFYFLKCEAQNLVPNGSFEEYNACPTLGGFNNDHVKACVVDWQSFGNTPDYFNVCAISPLVFIPSNLFGYQYPNSGNAYCGFWVMWSNEEHEIIGSQLIHPLEIGQEYYVEFYVCSGGDAPNTGGVFANHIGARFLMDTFSTNHPVAINNIAHVYSTSIIADTANWVKVSGHFIADSAYQYVAFGNFFTNAMTDTIQFKTGSHAAYYYIDDVCVSMDSLGCLATGIRIFNRESFSISPNPTTTTSFEITYTFTHPSTLTITNTYGLVVKQLTLTPNSGSTIIPVDDLPAGVYLVTLLDGEKSISKKVIILR